MAFAARMPVRLVRPQGRLRLRIQCCAMLYLIEDILGAPTITTPIVNHDNNQHSFNENLRIRNLWDGMELLAALLAM